MKRKSKSNAPLLIVLAVVLAVALFLQSLPVAAAGGPRKGGHNGEGGRRNGPEAVLLGVAVEGENSAIPVDIIIGGGRGPMESKGEEGEKHGMLIMFDRPFPLKIKKFSPDSLEAEIIKREQRGDEDSPDKSAKPSVFKIGEVTLSLPKEATEKKDSGSQKEGSASDEGFGGGRKGRGRGQTAGLVGKLSIKAGDMEIDSKEANYKIYMRPVPDMRGE